MYNKYTGLLYNIECITIQISKKIYVYDVF